MLIVASAARWAADRELQKDAVARWHTAFPDYCYHVENLPAEADTVTVNTLSTGMHTGVFDWAGYGPWPASGRQISIREIFFLWMSDEHIAEMTATWNPDALRQQLGIVLPHTSAERKRLIQRQAAGPGTAPVSQLLAGANTSPTLGTFANACIPDAERTLFQS